MLATDLLSFWKSYYGDDFSNHTEQDEHGYRTHGLEVCFPSGRPYNRKPFKNLSLRERWNLRFESRNHAGFFFLGYDTMREDEVRKQLDFIN